MTMTRPMLAATAERIEDIRYPCAVTPKLDGIRAITRGGELLTRSFKLVPNHHIRKLCEQLPNGLDGELISGANFNETQSAVMSRGNQPDFTYVVFDCYGDEPYWNRAHSLTTLGLPSFCVPLLPVAVNNIDELKSFEHGALEAGYEGIICRDALAHYICRRSSLREHYMVKFKRFIDSEAVVLAVLEGSTNENPQVADNFGYMKRPGGQAGKVARGTMGSLLCRDVHTDVEVRIAGFTEAMRAEVWANPMAYIGKQLRYRYQREEGCAPRFPRFMGWRAPE